MIVPNIRSLPIEMVVSIDAFEQYRSLRGAVAYALLTRADVAVYTLALQRTQESNTTIAHIKAVNAIVHRLHTVSHKMAYKPFRNSQRDTTETVFLCYCDSAFKKEDESGHAIKGIIICRLERF